MTQPSTLRDGGAVVPAHPFVYRQISFDLAAFDHLKAWQRHYARLGQHLTNSQVLSRLVLSAALP